jgi:flagellar biosynthesis protein FliQ/dienelactone hydrolase
MTPIERIKTTWQKIREAATPSKAAWQGATMGVCLLVTLLVVALFASFIIQDFTLQKVPAFLALIGALFLIGALALLVYHQLGKLAPLYRMTLFILAPFVFVVFAPGDEMQSAAFGAALLLIASFIGAGVAVLRRDGLKPLQQKVTLAITVMGFGGLILGLYAIFSDKDSANPLLDDYVLADRTLDLPNPGLPGDYKVLTLTYGSGKDIHRPEFGAGADLVSRSVDGAKLIDNWDGLSGWLRTSYWGFDATELPLQARVWYPQGDGPFPLVLIVHGNHSMEDYSDPGYGYLGELLASRGIIFASVDENFLNSSISAWVEIYEDRPGLKEENDARGWLLLEHLAQWRDWNSEPGHHFYNRVDIDRVALIGHSRGGEAVGIAASFNSLARYPDDASQEFDFGFNLRGVIAIAPVDGQYQPRDRGTPVRDVNYFTIHGSMDGDVQSFEGTSQYARVTFADENVQRFKASLYVTGANHGQFNTTWENLDTGMFSAWTLDLDGIMDGEAQRDIARVFFGAFMEIVLRDRKEYLPIFSDVRYAANWLPNTFYISQYANSTQRAIADFEEDIDPVTTTLAGGHIETEHLSKWHEKRVSLKYDDLDTHAGVYAWDREFDDQTAVVRFVLPTDWSGADSDTDISASISDAGIGTLPEDWEHEDSTESDAVDEEDEEPLDWTIELVDRKGQSASLPLSHDEILYPLIQAVPRRASFLDSNDTEEILFRRFTLPIDDFVAVNPSFDPASLAIISFVFDRAEKGAIIVDDLSLSKIQ